MLNQIKADALAARKARDAEKAALLSTLIGEIETLAKSGRGEITDAVIVTVIKKFVKNLNEVIANTDEDAPARGQALRERTTLETYLPKQLSTEELDDLIGAIIVTGATNVGDVMKILKQRHAGQYDGTTASALLKAKFAK